MGCFRLFLESSKKKIVSDIVDSVEFDDVQGVDEALASGADPDTTGRDGCPVLFAAIKNGSRAIVASLLRAGASTNKRDGDGNPPILALVLKGRLGPHRAPIAVDLIKNGADVNATSRSGMHPLWAAVGSEDQELVNVLIGAGVDWKKAVWSGGQTPLHRAVLEKRWNTAKELVSAGAPIDSKDSNGFSPADYLSGSSPAWVKKMFLR